MENSIFILSLRQLKKDANRCYHYDFEDILCQIDDARIFCVQPEYGQNFKERIINRLWRHVSAYFTMLNPGLINISIEKDEYETLFFYAMRPWDLIYLNCVNGWKNKFKYKILWLEEIWMKEILFFKNALEIAKYFDIIITSCYGTQHELEKMLNKPVYYQCPSTDSIKFSPYPNFPKRNIDVYSLGRKNEDFHKILVELQKENIIFYVHDTIASSSIMPSNHQDHRLLVANIAKRSKYFTVNQAKLDRYYETKGQIEIGPRFFEGIAGGCILVGQKAENDIFNKIFHWKGAVIDINYQRQDILKLFDEKDNGNQEMNDIRKNNILNSLSQHDCVYRWKFILDKMNIKASPKIDKRFNQINRIKNIIEDRNHF